jgi:putative heme-binding domain-containing protein
MVTGILPIVRTAVCIGVALGAGLPGAPVFAQSATALALARGRTLFEMRCATCHGLDARGGTAPTIARGSAAAAYTDDRLRRIIRDGLPSGMPGVGSSVPAADLTALVRHLRLLQRGSVSESSVTESSVSESGASQGGASDAAEPAIAGDATIGRALYFGKADCARCHAAEGRGGFLGSDLARTRLSPPAIRQAILHPEPSTRGTLATFTLRDGTRTRGLVRNEDNFSLQLQDERGAFHSIDKASIASMSRDAHPLMPTDYGQRLSDADIQNLLRYITQLAHGPDRATR